MATIKEIAELAGVSRGTVDRVLNNRGMVNPNTARKVKEIADALNYKPNRAALILSAQKKNIKLGVILFGTTNPFFDEVKNGIEEKKKELEYYNCSVEIKCIPMGAEYQLEAIDYFIKNGINGIALSPYNDKRIAEKINELFDMNIPVVTLNTDIEGSKRIAYVGSNYYLSGKTAAGLMNLVTKGEVNVGIVSGSENVMCHSERIEGFKECIAKNYTNIKIINTIYNDDDDIKSFEITSELIKNNNINALFFVAGGVYGGCRAVISANKQNSISIIAFDNVPTTKEMLDKNIIKATICQQPEIQGSKPLDILFDYLSTGSLPSNELNYVSADIRIKENMNF
ncbi:LacI family DNA-binding transcriptional regulator [Clostridium sp. SM-530-WT-3G]|uniref:LacI family DNA-binding transcriptional regulator n=1 Tax=Clostridium sp. SM-530-WT-3G TaxID=2725303 RepID=UPI00145C8BC9|nr:LacI family DNA-binding transcriptional regulator [Clostridium sp. SM-530-WT-3G]NME84312.1 substrate-binding domain-containing protein [Clostridium sp. SM-530-WT-3G]